MIGKMNIHFIREKSKEDVIKNLLRHAYFKKPSFDFDEVYNKILQRESLMSTGIGKGVAIPHAGLMDFDEMMIEMGILREGVEWNSFDKEPVKIVILVVFDMEMRNEYLKIMGKINEILREEETRMKIINARSREEVEEIFSNIGGSNS